MSILQEGNKTPTSHPKSQASTNPQDRSDVHKYLEGYAKPLLSLLTEILSFKIDDNMTLIFQMVHFTTDYKRWPFWPTINMFKNHFLAVAAKAFSINLREGFFGRCFQEQVIPYWTISTGCLLPCQCSSLWMGIVCYLPGID